LWNYPEFFRRFTYFSKRLPKFQKKTSKLLYQNYLNSWVHFMGSKSQNFPKIDMLMYIFAILRQKIKTFNRSPAVKSVSILARRDQKGAKTLISSFFYILINRSEIGRNRSKTIFGANYASGTNLINHFKNFDKKI